MSQGLTQSEVGEHLGLSQQQVSQWLAKLDLSLADGIDRIRLAYIEALRAAAGAQGPSAERDAYFKVRRQAAELRLAREAGGLADVKAVRKIAFEAARQTRDAILDMPHRVDPMLFGVSEKHARFVIWDREMRAICANLARLIANGLDELERQ